MSKASRARVSRRISWGPKAPKFTDVTPQSPFHFDYQRERDLKPAKPVAERALTDSDRRDLAAAEAKRERKAAR